MYREDTKPYTICYNGFHGHTTLRLRVPIAAKAGDTIEISPAVARRLNRACCAVHDCQCGEGIAGQDGWSGPWLLTLPEDGGEMRGRYAQR